MTSSDSLLSNFEQSAIAFQIAGLGYWFYNKKEKTIQLSDEAYRIFGLSPAEQIEISDLQDPSSPFYFLQEIHEQTLRTGKFCKDIILLLPSLGRRQFFVCCERQAQSNHLGGIIQDITDRQIQEAPMTKSQEWYQEIFNQSKDAIFICTFEGQLVDFNEATESLLGYPAEELFLIKNLHEHYQTAKDRKEFLEKLQSEHSVKDFSLQVTNKRGEVRSCLLSANILQEKNFVGYNCIVRDITEQIQAEKMKKARDLAKQAAKMKEQFIASVSHEMRTPMNAILGMSNILLDMKMPEEETNLVKSIKQSSEILLGIVNDILEISAMQNQKISFEIRHFDLHELLANLVNVMQYKAQSKKLSFEVILADGIPRYLKGDRLRLNQVLFNLVGNAIKFTDNGFVKIKIKMLFEVGDSVQLQFVVEDSGIGITPEKIPAVFESFTRIRTKDRIFEGTGLGLSICKNIVEQQGGKIGASSNPGEGSRFFFDLIFEKSSADEEITTPEVSEPAKTVADSNAAFSLLLVEDHKMNQLVAKKTLTRKWKNIDLVITENGKEAIDVLKKRTFDLVLLDIQMPVMDGYETAQYIRSKMPAPIASLPLIAMTAHAHLARDKKYAEYGMDDCVLKPFKPDELFEKISRFLPAKP